MPNSIGSSSRDFRKNSILLAIFAHGLVESTQPRSGVLYLWILCRGRALRLGFSIAFSILGELGFLSPRLIPMSETITLHHIYLSSGHDFKGRFEKGRLNNGTSEVDSVECLEGRGLVGDRYFDYKEDYKGQVSLISLEAIKEMESILGLPAKDLSLFRRNVVVAGVDLNALVGQDFNIGEVGLRGVEQCKPCFWMDEAVGEGAFKALENRGGLRCRILSSGRLKKGESELLVSSL